MERGAYNQVKSDGPRFFAKEGSKYTVIVESREDGYCKANQVKSSAKAEQ